MIELKFHESLYDRGAVDEATKIYGPYADIELSRDATHYVVTIKISPETESQGITENMLGAEMVNYALGKTIENLGGDKPAGANGGAA
jgi:hypothetical protein